MLEDGKITESGTHDELVAANKSYAAMWKRYEDAQAGTFGEVTE